MNTVMPQLSTTVPIPTGPARDRAVSALHRSASLVHAWGRASVLDGRSVSDSLTIGGVSCWDLVSPELARIHVAQALLPGTPPFWMDSPVRVALRRVKHRAIALKREWRGTSDACRTWPADPAVLCLAFSGYLYRDVLAPVVGELSNAGHAVVAVHDGAHFHTIDAAEEPPLESIWRHVDGGVRRKRRDLQRQLARTVSSLRAAGNMPQVVRDEEGHSLWGPLAGMFDWLFDVYFPSLLHQGAIADHVLERHPTTLVISPDVADPRTRLYTLLSRRRGIPTLEIQSAPCGLEGIEWRFFRSDGIAAVGECSREAMRFFGAPDERITVLGSPRYDKPAVTTDAVMRRGRAALGVPGDRTLLLFASAYSYKGLEGFCDSALLNAMKRAVFEAADSLPGVCLLVKPHPLEDIDETRRLATGLRHIMFAEARMDIRELIGLCDAFVSLGTTATLDALIARKLTICPSFPGFVWSDQYITSGATLVARTPGEVVEHFQASATAAREHILERLEPARRAFVQYWAFEVDGCAASRIAALAARLAGQSVTGL